MIDSLFAIKEMELITMQHNQGFDVRILRLASFMVTKNRISRKLFRILKHLNMHSGSRMHMVHHLDVAQAQNWLPAVGP